MLILVESLYPLEVSLQYDLVVSLRALLVVGGVDPADQLLNSLFIKLTQRLASHSCSNDQVVDVFDRPQPAVALGKHVVDQTLDRGFVLLTYLF